MMAGCSKDSRLMYKEDPRIYFYTSDIVEYSFAAQPESLMVDTIYLPIRIMGSAVNTDRTFSLNIDDSSTAKLGYHFSFGPFVIPANTYQVDLPVYMYRRPGLKDSTVTAYISIGESSDFKAGYVDGLTTNGTAGGAGRLHYKISITDQLLKPSNWETVWVNYFGTYSQVKFKFLIQTTGRTDWTWTGFPQDLNFSIQTAKYALYNYELANGPLIDEFGNRVVFP
jgi:hypothetical protein